MMTLAPLPDWPAMEHAVPVTRYPCKLCGLVKLATAYAPSELRPYRKRTQAGTPYVAAAQQRCRVCLWQMIRARQAVRRPRGHGDTAGMAS